jgi:hypothetical protein
MTTFAERAMNIAEGEIGVHENPWGSNCGGCEKYQKPWGSWMVGQPWCGAFVAWVWEQADMDGMGLADPSTATMCNIAGNKGLKCPPRHGAAVVLCGAHTELLHHDLGGGVWKTIEGNSNDQVRWVQRSIGGMTIYAPPEIKSGAPAAPPTQTWYYIEDVHQKGIREFGGWSSQKSRDKALAGMENPGHYRKFKRDYPDPKYPYFFEDPSKSERYYGGWLSKDGRDKSLASLEEQYGREMRPFSRQQATASGGEAEDIGKVD